MQNYVQPGNRLTLTAPYAVSAGGGVKIGQMFGVAATDAESAADVEVDFVGVFDLAKVGSQAWTMGALVYWDNTNKYCTTTATSNLLIGAAVAAVGSGAGETVGRVRLNGIVRADEAGP